MKEFIVEFTETVTYTTIIEASSEEHARYKFLEGEFNDCDEVCRDYEGINSVTPDFDDEEDEE